jgi:hypothetical protein
MGGYYRNYGGGFSIDWADEYPPSEKEVVVSEAVGLLLPKFRRCVLFLLQEVEPRTTAAVRISYPDDAPEPTIFEVRYDTSSVSMAVGIFEGGRLLGTVDSPLGSKEETVGEIGSRWVKIGDVGTNTGTFLIADPSDVVEGAERELPPYEEMVWLRRSDRVSVAVKHSPEHRPSRDADDYLALQLIDEQYRNPSAMVVAPGDDGLYEVYARTIVSFGHEHFAEVKIVFDEPSWLHLDLSKEDVKEALDRDKSKRRTTEQ